MGLARNSLVLGIYSYFDDSYLIYVTELGSPDGSFDGSNEGKPDSSFHGSKLRWSHSTESVNVPSVP